MNISIDGRSLLGTREDQQDYYIYKMTDELVLAAVCDGMGGLKGGALASQTAANLFKEDVQDAFPVDDIPDYLVREAHRLDEAVFSLTDDGGKWLGAGCTIVAVLIKDDKLFWLTVGDSRIFICRGEEVMPLNREHNYRLQLDALLKEDRITPEDYERENKYGGRLISYLGEGNITIMDVNTRPIELQKGDRLLLCTDGVTKSLSNTEICELLMKYPHAKMIAERTEANILSKELRNQDNATFVAITCEESVDYE